MKISPPAFPTYLAENMAHGITMRDYFAAAVMQGLIQIVQGCELGKNGSAILPDSIRLSNVAYGMADAMMEARNK